MHSERRDHRRHRRRLQLRFRNPGSVWRRAFAVDVSATGLFLGSSQIPNAEQVIEIEADLPTGKVLLSGRLVRGLRAPSRIQRIARGGFAVQLDSAPEEWAAYCKSLDKPDPLRR